ncbi:MAG TPA: hypothetical protein ENG83_00490 [Nitrospirae bacterium]|nr:doubled CXXCH motif [bacterium BMS3Abin06]HDH10681.1 hypothetical protein [Nitrospirota bacterium]
MKKLAISIIFLLILPSVLFSAKENIKNSAAVSKNTDIHYTGKYCSECHEKTPVKGGNKFLKSGGDFTQLCKCHGYTPGAYIHPAGVVPSEEKRKKIPEDFPLKDGRISCSTCHDIYLQCRKNPRLKVLNKRFLRGAPYVSRTTLCFRCHDEKKYRMLDPHNQLTEKGAIIVDKCLYCHVKKPDEKTATFKEVRLIGNLEALCFRCHFKQSRFHPINANHLVKPSPAIIKNMKDAEQKFGIILPLNYEGKITCPTCHNPHERGVIPWDKPSAKGASEKYRLRLSELNLQICIACHKDKF